jgi:hypothetical protein
MRRCEMADLPPVPDSRRYQWVPLKFLAFASNQAEKAPYRIVRRFSLPLAIKISSYCFEQSLLSLPGHSQDVSVISRYRDKKRASRP